MAIRMQPVRSVFARMPRLVRDISGRLGKKVRLVTSGDRPRSTKPSSRSSTTRLHI